MLKKKLFLIPLLAGLMFVFPACNNFDTGNSRTFTDVFGVVKSIDYFQNNLVTFSTTLGEIVANELPTQPLNEGDCVYFYQFIIDYDNQPSDKYLIASGVQYEQITKEPFSIESGSSIPTDGYDLKLSEIQILSSPYLYGSLFTSATFSKMKEQGVNFRLVFNPDEPAENGALNVYMQARLSGTASGATENSYAIRAFNARSLLMMAGRDTTVQEVSFRYAKINLKYMSGTENGEPVYSKLENPIELLMFRESSYPY
ncbi:hypothetical protein FACS189432_06820 [Bacteroidia bacterium]|nr:hypothetical protein FACS189426_10600 [Bacteroidia bacterium]GHT28627.1 hypothetical protein FACS189432_06820 [Bacteroidia bacterium]